MTGFAKQSRAAHVALHCFVAVAPRNDDREWSTLKELQ
jgi:hypothetical protein